MSDAPKAVPRLGRCPQCGTSSRLDPQNGWRPFCSERCKLIDLGEWFSERHQVIEPLFDKDTPQS